MKILKQFDAFRGFLEERDSVLFKVFLSNQPGGILSTRYDVSATGTVAIFRWLSKKTTTPGEPLIINNTPIINCI